MENSSSRTSNNLKKESWKAKPRVESVQWISRMSPKLGTKAGAESKGRKPVGQ
jgi:hypothetical protein